MLSKYCFLSILLLLVVAVSAQTPDLKKGKSSPNVLFIMVDDLRPELGCYGSKQIKTPHMDQLAKEAVLFKNAYCNIPVCGASRASVLTGILPKRDRFVQYDAKASEDVPEAKTLPQVFKEAGYHTRSLGKIFHDPADTDAKSWSEPAVIYVGDNQDFMFSGDPTTNDKLSKKGRGRIYEMPDVADNFYNDGQVAEATITALKAAKESNQSFFIACGFFRPHLPFYAPKKYWDLYDRDALTLADNTDRPINAPTSLRGSGELWSYHMNGFKPKTEAFRKMMKHGYYASVSYSDQLVGDVLRALKALDLDENTIVVLWGDHGWHLGEHDFWGKHNTMLPALKVPLIVRVPGGNIKGQIAEGIVESVDIFPTLCELTGLEMPAQLHGKSFKKILNNSNKKIRKNAYSRFLAADAISTKRYSYTHYTGKKDEKMLYDLRKDPEQNTNVADQPKYKRVVRRFKKYLRKAKRRAERY